MEEEKAKHGFKLKGMHIAVIIIIAIAIIGVLVYFVGLGGASPTVVNGDNVSVYYTLKLANGTVYNTNVGQQPLNFTVGENEVIPGFDHGIVGMQVGQNKTLVVPPAQGYGMVNQSLIVSVALSRFGNATVTNGMIVTDSQGLRATIIAVNSTNATVDFNPPLAGKTLIFVVKLVAIHK